MRIGFASKILAYPEGKMRSLIKRLATEEALMQVTKDNLTALDNILEYCRANDIPMFRVSSDVIPFGSSPVNTLDWLSLFSEQLEALGRKARDYDIRLSMHPGQYTVLNSFDTDVVERAIVDLEYHAAFLDALHLPDASKIILHVGGAYGDKENAIKRFAAEYSHLDPMVKRRLIVENDDRIFTGREVLRVSEMTGAPMVFDILHHRINHDDNISEELTLLDAAAATWKPEDGVAKIHYSQQAPGRKPGSHSDTTALDEFLEFIDTLEGRQPDIMLEVKDKNLSAVKVIAALDTRKKIAVLEREWARYKYVVLERDQALYHKIRTLLNDKSTYPVREFYDIVEQALATPIDKGSSLNAIQHVWGYVSGQVDSRERSTYDRLLSKYLEDHTTLEAMKKRLEALATTYQQEYLLHSYYFVL